MRKSSHWVHRQGKRAQAVAYGCYPPDSDPNPLDLERDSQEVEAQAAKEERQEARRVLDGIRESSKGTAVVGEWEPKE